MEHRTWNNRTVQRRDLRSSYSHTTNGRTKKWYIKVVVCGREFTGMNVGVFLHVRLLVEAFSTELARIRTRVGVDEKMCWQRRRTLETLSALHARERTTCCRGWCCRVSISVSAFGYPLAPPSRWRHVTWMNVPEAVSGAVKRRCPLTRQVGIPERHRNTTTESAMHVSSACFFIDRPNTRNLIT